MRSGWFFGTEEWNRYLQEYAKTRPECLHEWKSSPLAKDHDFLDALEDRHSYTCEQHESQVIDLRTHKWSDIRKSYRGLINKAKRSYSIDEYDETGMRMFKELHIAANGGQPRNDATYAIQEEWIMKDIGILVLCSDWPNCYAGAYWIVYNGCAYFASGPNIQGDLQHAVIWKSLHLLRERGVVFVEMGQVDGISEKEKSIGFFKSGWGGELRPFTIVRRVK
jgi:hypothetical protein